MEYSWVELVSVWLVELKLRVGLLGIFSGGVSRSLID
jgi:hypothetical protein